MGIESVTSWASVGVVLACAACTRGGPPDAASSGATAPVAEDSAKQGAPPPSAGAAVPPIGQATMQADGSIVLDLYRPAHMRETYAPSDPRHADILRHVGGLKPGEQKLVPPWPDPYDAARIEAAVHAYIAEKKRWSRDAYKIDILGDKDGEVLVSVVHADDRAAKAPGGGKSIRVYVAIATYGVVRELAFQ